MTRNRSYSELAKLETFVERFHYLSLAGLSAIGPLALSAI